MTKQRAPQEFNTFGGGIHTDSNPLNFPDGKSLDEVNLVLNRDGSRQRRLGMDLETNYSTITTNVKANAIDNVIFKTYLWENAGDIANKDLTVIQCGNEIKIYDLDNEPLSSTVIYTKRYVNASKVEFMSFSTVDSLLIVVNGDGTVYSYEYDNGTITETTSRIEVRDFWGVEDNYDVNGESTDITSGNNVNIRPTTLEDNHLYNLRNQGWGIPRPTVNSALILEDPIEEFFDHGHERITGGASSYPSNADNINLAYYAHASFTSEPYLKTFWARDLGRVPVGSVPTAKGFFIIDILERGLSRKSVMSANHIKYPDLNYTITDLSDDVTSGGATVTAEYAGRAWFGGFSGTISESDSKSPKLASYVTFSQVVKNPSDITKCYQFADPTDPDDSELVATDGGFIRIDDAYGIKALVQSGASLLVFAQNGVWRIVGGSDFGFAADNYSVEKIKNAGGCRSAASVVDVEGTILYWGDDGIFVVTTTEVGDWAGKNISQDSIQELYDAIPVESKEIAAGIYDKFERKVRWVYNNNINSSLKTKELVLDIDRNTYTTTEIQELPNNTTKVVGILSSNPFTLENITTNVQVNGVDLEVNGEQVQVTYQQRVEQEIKFFYVVVLAKTSFIEYSFAEYKDTDFLDWKTVDSTGIDAAAYITTGYLALGDNARRKQIPKLIVYCERTENGVYEDGNGQLQLSNPSSCKVQAQWNWTNSSNANRWSPAREFYRYRRPYLPTDVNDTMDTGDLLVIGKDIVRGHGKNVSFKFSTSPGKNMKLQGWNLDWEVGNAPGS